MYRLELELIGLPKTVNGPHGSWQRAAAERKKWRSLVEQATLGKRPSKPLDTARITLTRLSSNEPDYDNLAASFKSVVDGLRDAGIIVDDKKKNIGACIYLWEKTSPKNGKIRVLVEEIKDFTTAAPVTGGGSLGGFRSVGSGSELNEEKV
jgi:Holliday junction resolvase RusA-like endonuclease